MEQDCKQCFNRIYAELKVLEEAAQSPREETSALKEKVAEAAASFRLVLKTAEERVDDLCHELAEKEDLLAIGEQSIETLDTLAGNLQTEKQSLESRNEELAYLADHDALTGLYNRRFLMTTMKHELERSRRTGGSASAVMIDLDHFKHVNDTHGHLAGDAVLRAFADVLRSQIRKMDFVGRYGGEEFLAFLPSQGERDAEQVVRRLQKVIRGMEVEHDDVKLRVTASFGIATHSPTDKDTFAMDLLLRADQALYRAKENGRDRYETWDESLRKSPRMPNIQRVNA